MKRDKNKTYLKDFVYFSKIKLIKKSKIFFLKRFSLNRNYFPKSLNKKSIKTASLLSLYTSSSSSFIAFIVFVKHQQTTLSKLWKISFGQILQQSTNWLLKFLKSPQQQLEIQPHPKPQQQRQLGSSNGNSNTINTTNTSKQKTMPCLGSIKHHNVCPAYCDCEFPLTTKISSYRGFIPDLVKCRCGEDDAATHSLDWIWHNPNDATKQIQGQDIVFHPTFSQGTAIVRGEQPLAADMLHFWEIRVLTSLSGTDVVSRI